MANQVCSGAAVACTFGTDPAEFAASSADVTATASAGVITDVSPENIPTFGMCSSLANPEVESATTAADGVLTPQPCVPELSPWTPGSGRVTINGVKTLDDESECRCTYLGVITVSDPGQEQVTTE